MNKESLYIVIAEHDPDLLRRLELFFRKRPEFTVCAVALTGNDAVERCGEFAPDVLLTDYQMPDMRIEDIVHGVMKNAPGILIFAITPVLSSTVKSVAINNQSIKEIWDERYLDLEDIASTILRIADETKQAQKAAEEKYGRVTPGTGPQRRNEVITTSVTNILRQKVILVHSPKGGVGKTTIATNLAVAIKQSSIYSTVQVVLIDADTEFSNDAQVLNLPDAAINKDITKWEYVPDNVGPDEVTDLLAQHRSGIYLLAAPMSPAAGHEISGELMDKVLRILKKYCGVIIIDGGPKLPPPVEAALDHTTDILLVTEPEFQGVENIKRYADILQMAGKDYVLDRVRLVINRVSNLPEDLSLREIANITGIPVTRAIPEDPKAVRGALHGTNGRLAVEAYPSSDFAVAVKQLANDIAGAYPSGMGTSQQARPKTRKSLFSIFSR